MKKLAAVLAGVVLACGTPGVDTPPETLCVPQGWTFVSFYNGGAHTGDHMVMVEGAPDKPRVFRVQHTRYNTNGEFMLIAEHGAGECK